MIQLQDISQTSLEEIQRLANNHAIAINLRDAFPYPYTIENAATFLELATNGALGRVYGVYDGDIFVGCCSLIQGEKSDFYYANWTNGRDKGEVDMVWTDPATQKAFSLAEVKWTDRFYEKPTELKSLNKFLESNCDIRKIIVTTKSKTGIYDTPHGKIFFIPAAIYAYWVSDFLYKNKRDQLLTSNEMSK